MAHTDDSDLCFVNAVHFQNQDKHSAQSVWHGC